MELDFGTVCVAPPETVQVAVPSVNASVRFVVVMSSQLLGFVTVMAPVTFHPLSVTVIV